MATLYGRNTRRITAADVNNVYTQNFTVTTSGDVGKGFVLDGYHTTGGCGTTDPSGVFIELKDDVPWTYITMEFYLTGTAACWSFNNGGYPNAINNTGNLLSFNSSLDRVFNSTNSFELPQFAIKMNACDNNANNFMHGSFQVGSFRTFRVTRRRNTSGNLAGPHHGRSCNSTGTGARTIIKNIFVW